MEVFYEDACAHAQFLSGSKKEIADFDQVIGSTAAVITPFYELNDSACTPTLSLRESDTQSDYTDLAIPEASDYVTTSTTDSVSFYTNLDSDLSTVRYFQLVLTIEGSLTSDVEDEGMMTYEFAVTYIHECARNELTRVGDTVAFKYFVESSEVHQYTPSVINSVSGCTHEATISQLI